MESTPTNNDPMPTNTIVNCIDASFPPTTQDHIDVKIFQLMALVMLPGELDQCASNTLQRKGSRKTIQREWENTDEQFDLVPQLERDDESMRDLAVPVIQLN